MLDQLQAVQSETLAIGNFTIESTRDVEEEASTLIQLFETSQEHVRGLLSFQRQEPSTLEFQTLLSSPSIMKYVVKDKDGKPCGIFIFGYIGDFQSLPGNICCTRFLDTASFTQELSQECGGNHALIPECIRNWNLPHEQDPDFDLEALGLALRQESPLVYMCGHGWSKSSEGVKIPKQEILKQIKRALLPLHFPCPSTHPPILFEETETEQDIAATCAISTKQAFPSLLVGIQDYVAIRPLEQYKRAALATAYKALLTAREKNIKAVSMFPRLRTVPDPPFLVDLQRFSLDLYQLKMDIYSTPETKRPLLDPLYNAYKSTFYRSEVPNHSLQVQSQNKETLAAVLDDQSSVIVLLTDDDDSIRGFWVAFSDMHGLFERHPELDGIHSFQFNHPRYSGEKEHRLLYTFTIGSVPTKEGKPSRAIGVAFVPTLISLLNTGIEILGDMSVSTKASGRILSQLNGLPFLDTESQRQKWYISI